MPLPMRIQNAPDLMQGLEFYYAAFQSLTTSRALGYGSIGPIPYAAIANFCREEEIVGEMRSDVFYHVEHLDYAYMNWQTAKTKKEAEK